MFAFFLILNPLSSGLFGQSSDQPEDVIYFEDLAQWMEADQDTTYVLNFWATWCRPCVKELPHFEKLHHSFAGKKAKVILISLDFIEDYHNRYRPFLEKRKLVPPVFLLDEPKYNTWIDRVDSSWSGAIPATLVIPGDGSAPRFFEQEFTSYDELAEKVNDLISE